MHLHLRTFKNSRSCFSRFRQSCQVKYQRRNSERKSVMRQIILEARPLEAIDLSESVTSRQSDDSAQRRVAEKHDCRGIWFNFSVTNGPRNVA
jgi:hypothetical protein